MIYGSVCSGIEAATVAWHGLGWKPAWFSEIEKFPCAVLAHHYPHVPNLGDMTKIRDRVISGEVAAPDVLVGGTPCQAFSVAGLRNSLNDDRGLLTLEYVRLADAIDSARLVRGQQPCVVVWENVPGALSTKDNAFGCFLGELSGSGCELQPSGRKWGNAGCVYGPKRAIAWRVLDAQYFGLAQRRKRVFVVASAMEGFNPAEILFEYASLSGNPAPGSSTQQDIAGTLEASAGRSRGAGTSPAILTVIQETGFSQFVEATTAATLKKCGGSVGGGSESLIVEPQGGELASGRNVTGTPLSNAGTKLWQGNQEAFSGDFFVIHGTQSALMVRTRMRVRRFMPIECERLQGFSDNYTYVPYRNKMADDGPRYAALGNSMAVPVMRWIGERIAQYLEWRLAA